MAANKAKKKQTLRNNEYYSTPDLFDDLYERSQPGEVFTHLMELITSEQNILLAYRAIKKNKGSKTNGVNSTTIVEMGEKQPEELIAYVRKRLQTSILMRSAVWKSQNQMGVCVRWASQPWKTVLFSSVSSKCWSQSVKQSFINTAMASVPTEVPITR